MIYIKLSLQPPSNLHNNSVGSTKALLPWGTGSRGHSRAPFAVWWLCYSHAVRCCSASEEASGRGSCLAKEVEKGGKVWLRQTKGWGADPGPQSKLWAGESSPSLPSAARFVPTLQARAHAEEGWRQSPKPCPVWARTQSRGSCRQAPSVRAH